MFFDFTYTLQYTVLETKDTPLTCLPILTNIINTSSGKKGWTEYILKIWEWGCESVKREPLICILG